MEKQCSLPAWEYERYLGFYCSAIDETSSEPQATAFAVLTSVIFIHCICAELCRSILVPSRDISKTSQFNLSFSPSYTDTWFQYDCLNICVTYVYIYYGHSRTWVKVIHNRQRWRNGTVVNAQATCKCGQSSIQRGDGLLVIYGHQTGFQWAAQFVLAKNTNLHNHTHVKTHTHAHVHIHMRSSWFVHETETENRNLEYMYTCACIRGLGSKGDYCNCFCWFF